MKITLLVGSALALTFVLYVFYLAYCTLRLARDNGKLEMTPWIVRALAWAVLITGLVLDVLFNITIGTLMFREMPERPLTFTARCKKHLEAGGFRGELARWVCDGWLNPFEAGHC